MLNKIVIMGRLSHDPELRQAPSGASVCNFNVAVDRDFKNADGEHETDFLDVVAWRNTAEFVSKYFAKGRMIIVEGRLQIRRWTDKEGNNRRSAEIVADTVWFGESKPADAATGSTVKSNANVPAAAATSTPIPSSPANYAIINDADDELPF